MKTPSFIAALMGILLLNACTNNQLHLVDQGKTDYEIVYVDGANKTQQQAATLLADYLKQICGISLAVVPENAQTSKKKIYVGNVQNQALDPHQIIIKTIDKNLHMYGGSDLATQNAVYEFLETQLNCRWYAPTVAEIPHKKDISIPELAFSYTPKIKTRTVHARLFYDHPQFADQHKLTHEAFPYYVPEARVHTFHKFMPEEVFYKEHPEYYAQRGNQRLPTQLCLSNPQVLAIVKDSVAAHFKRHPAASVISVSQDDNQQHCQCDQCSQIDQEEGSPAGSMIRFVNQVAQAYPNKTIATLAYQYTRKPPKTKPAKNVLITLCSIECDRSAPIAQNCTDFSEDLIGWGKLTDNIRIWDYTTQFTNFLAPFPNIHTLQPNLQLFMNNNANWVFEQHSNHPSELFELRAYLTAKLLWNPKADQKAIITDFTNGYYKEAGPFIREYIDLIHAKIGEHPDFFLFLYGDPSEAFGSYLSADLLAQYSSIFDEAEKAVQQKPAILARVKTARLGVDYAVLEACRKNLSDTYSLTCTKAGKTENNPLVAPLLDNFIKTAKANNISLMNEMGFGINEYAANYLSALQLAKKPNKAKGKKVSSLSQPKKYADENPQILTDGALGGSSFYANWLGYEGNDMEVIIDLGKMESISKISTAFLQVTNHVVFLPTEVQYLGSNNNTDFRLLARLKNPKPLHKKSKVNDIQHFEAEFKHKNMRYIKIIAKNTPTPYWHHAAGLPSWVFADEVIVD